MAQIRHFPFFALLLDGMEQDHIAFDYGRIARIGPAEAVLRLVVE